MNNIKFLTDTARQGINLLGNNINKQLFDIYRNYVVSTLRIISNNTRIDYVNLYYQFLLYNSNLTFYEQVKKTVEFLLELAKNV